MRLFATVSLLLLLVGCQGEAGLYGPAGSRMPSAGDPILEGDGTRARPGDAGPPSRTSPPGTTTISEPTPTDGPGDAPPSQPPSDSPPSDAPSSEPPPSETPPAEMPPTETPPAEMPPAEMPPAETPPAETPPVVEPRDGGNTLFLGNSLMRFGGAGPYAAYDIPALVDRLRDRASETTRPAGSRQTYRLLAADGFGLHSWWTSWYGYSRDGETISAARAIIEDPGNGRGYDSDLRFTALPSGAHWDRVVMKSLANYVPMDGDFFQNEEKPAIFDFCNLIHETQPDAEILHYVGAADGRDIVTLQVAVDAFYRDQVLPTCPGRIVPIGAAFRASSVARPTLELRRPMADDWIHFNDRGVTLAAYVVYAVLYGDPREVDDFDLFGAVSAEERTYLAQLAFDTAAAVGSSAP